MLKLKAMGGKSGTDSSMEKEDKESSGKPQTPTSWLNQTAASNKTLVVSGVEKDDHKMSAVAASDETLAALNELKSLGLRGPQRLL
jgi:hypothetical protein